MKHALLVEVLSKYGHARLQVNGTSMLPALLPYDVVALQRPETNELSRGDIVLIESDGRCFLHRIAHLEAGWVQTRGDFLLHKDESLPIEKVCGKVVAVERFGRQLVAVPCFHPLAQAIARLDQSFPIPSSLAHIYARTRMQLSL
jgi:hypothetical protein